MNLRIIIIAIATVIWLFLLSVTYEQGYYDGCRDIIEKRIKNEEREEKGEQTNGIQ